MPSIADERDAEQWWSELQAQRLGKPGFCQYELADGSICGTECNKAEQYCKACKRGVRFL